MTCSLTGRKNSTGNVSPKTKFLLLSNIWLLSCTAQDATDTSYVREKDTMGFTVSFQRIGEGVELCVTDAPQRSILGDSRLTILKLDPSKLDFELFTASSGNKKPRPVNEWADSMQLNIVFNAGMYDLSQPLTGRGLLKNGKHYNQPVVKEGWNAVMVMNPVDTLANDCDLVSVGDHPWTHLKSHFGGIIQSLRMLDGQGNPTWWKKKPQSCSMLVMAEDENQQLYLIFTRSPYIHNTMISFLQQFPVKLKNAIYLEGGPETSLYVSIGDVQIQKVGSYVSQTYPKDSNDHFWPLPNVIGIRLKP